MAVRKPYNVKLVADPVTPNQVLLTFSYDYGSVTTDYEVYWFYTDTSGNEYQDATDKWATLWGDPAAKRRTHSYDPEKVAQVKARIWCYPSGFGTKDQAFQMEWVEVKFDVNKSAWPTTPSTPDVSIENGYLIMSLHGVASDTYEIEFQVTGQDAKVFTTGKAIVDSNRNAQYRVAVLPGGEYFVRARAFKANKSLYSWWSERSYPGVKAVPAAPYILSVKTYTVNSSVEEYPGAIEVNWTRTPNGNGSGYSTTEKYRIEYTTNINSFINNVVGDIKSVETEDATRTSYIIDNDLVSGNTYYVRVAAVNSTGLSDYSAILSVIIGSRPLAPTTWSSSTTIRVGDEVMLYWVHNPTDGSSQTNARINLSLKSGPYSYQTHEQQITLTNTTDPAHKDDTGCLIINTAEGSYTYLGNKYLFTVLTPEVFAAGGQLKWSIDTRGVWTDTETEGYSEISVQRQIDIYSKPVFKVSSNNFVASDSGSEYELHTYPIYITATTTVTDEQAPISYHLSITANQAYRTIDALGQISYVAKDQIIYDAFYDDTGDRSSTSKNVFYFKRVVLSAGDVDLENGAKYTLTMSVTLNSAITETDSIDFQVNWEENTYLVDASFELDNDILAMTVFPRCLQNTYTAINPSSETYANQNPRERGWYEYRENWPGNYMWTTNTTVVSGKQYYKLDESKSELTYIPVEPASETYANQNPAQRGWYELNANNEYIISNDTLVDQTKTYYILDGSAASEDPVLMSVYRRNYDNTFTLIADNIINNSSESVIDPHPTLNGASYRIVAMSQTNGGISYQDFYNLEVNEKSLVIQWDESWSNYYYDDNMDIKSVEYPYAGSMLKLPWNVDISSSNAPDVASVEYIGRQHPVSYYGTQLGETASWSTDVDKKDTDTLAKIRELMTYMGDVYVREPSGIGFWANVKLSYNMNHTELVIPVSIEITRVEGGI